MGGRVKGSGKTSPSSPLDTEEVQTLEKEW